jgi:hypothetical protein
VKLIHEIYSSQFNRVVSLPIDSAEISQMKDVMIEIVCKLIGRLSDEEENIQVIIILFRSGYQLLTLQ